MMGFPLTSPYMYLLTFPVSSPSFLPVSCSLLALLPPKYPHFYFHGVHGCAWVCVGVRGCVGHLCEGKCVLPVRVRLTLLHMRASTSGVSSLTLRHPEV